MNFYSINLQKDKTEKKLKLEKLLKTIKGMIATG